MKKGTFDSQVITEDDVALAGCLEAWSCQGASRLLCALLCLLSICRQIVQKSNAGTRGRR